MKSPYRALLWEQARTAGVICLTLGVMSGLFVLTRRVFLFANIMRVVRSQDVAELFFCFSLAGAGLSVIRQDVRGHVTGGIDPRWFRLPIQMPALFSIVVGARVLFLAVLVSFQVYILAALTLPGIPTVEIVFLAILPFYLYLLIQATAWSWKRIPLLWYGLLAALLALPLLFRFWGLNAGRNTPITTDLGAATYLCAGSARAAADTGLRHLPGTAGPVFKSAQVAVLRGLAISPAVPRAAKGGNRLRG